MYKLCRGLLRFYCRIDLSFMLGNLLAWEILERFFYRMYRLFCGRLEFK